MSEVRFTDKGIKVSAVLDVKGLNSPVPLLRIKKELCKLTSGDILQIDGTDSASYRDIPGWCERTGNRYLGEKGMLGYTSFFLKKK